MKKYIAKTNVSINVVLSTGANRHVCFSPLTGGGSVFYTSDKELQKALERHYKYGSLFRVEPAKQTAVSMFGDGADSSTEADGCVKADVSDEGLKRVVVSDPDSAKAYLSEHFGISRTKIKTVDSIRAVAAANGIEFEGL